MIARKSPEAAFRVSCLSMATLAGINLRLPFSIIGTKVSPASKKSALSKSGWIFRGSLRGRPRGFPQVPGANWPSLLRGMSTLLYHASEGARSQTKSARPRRFTEFLLLQKFRPIGRPPSLHPPPSPPPPHPPPIHTPPPPPPP